MRDARGLGLGVRGKKNTMTTTTEATTIMPIAQLATATALTTTTAAMTFVTPKHVEITATGLPAASAIWCHA